MKWIRNVVGLLAVFFCSCQSSQELDIWPLVYYEQQPEENKTRLDILTSLYSYRSTLDETHHAARPFFVGEFIASKEETRLMFFWPFIYYSQKPNEDKVWILPFYHSIDQRSPERGERDFDWFFLPFFTFGGADTKEGPYLFMGPWGNIKGKFGYDEIQGRPFPFYVTARDGEYQSRAYLWPFFRFGEGGGKRFEFYAFMYSDYEKEGEFRRRSYLWPFFHYNLENLDKKHPGTEFMFFPFYGQATSAESQAYMVLWPFFSSSRHDNGYREYNLPWPFFKSMKGEGKEEFRLWPFYWNIHSEKTAQVREDDLMILWPLFWHLTGDYPSHSKESLYVMPFYWHHWKKGKEENAPDSERLKIWPVYDYRREEDGSVRHRALSPLWFDDYLPEGFEKAWQPLFTMFEYGTGKNGETTASILGPLYNYQKEENSLYHRVLFFSYKENNQRKMHRFSVLGGLFEYQNEAEEKNLRFFYLPLFSWGQKSPSPETQATEATETTEATGTTEATEATQAKQDSGN